MIRRIRLPHAAAALFALSSLAATPLGVASAEAAVVYCKTVGVPRGCVIRPTAPVARVVVRPAPVVVAPVVVAPRVGVGAPGVGVAPGRVGNRGGPVNRVGRR
ncbi:MAG TPA: hypothetical protein VGX71_22185 [Pseudaminobacter sp.]|jgi:hypothetical protein|nr:hypothetical protein [Pseudaminobacter sp.]